MYIRGLGVIEINLKMNQVNKYILNFEPTSVRLEIVSEIQNNVVPIKWENINREALLLNNQVQLNKDGKISTNILYTCIPKELLRERYILKRQNKEDYINS